MSKHPARPRTAPTVDRTASRRPPTRCARSCRTSTAPPTPCAWSASRRPAIGDNEVLVRVHAAGLDRGTWHLMTGKPYLMRIAGIGFRGPKNRVPGRDVAGTVEAVGSAVTRFAVGRRGVRRRPRLVRRVRRRPARTSWPTSRRRLSFEQAAVVPISAGTALQALTDHGRVEAGQRVLIIGASGGVGSYAVQLAKALGAEVTGVASTAKLDLVRSLGADHVLDYTRDDYADGTHRYDLILDIAGQPDAVPAAPRAHAHGNGRARRRRGRRQPDRRHEPAAAGAGRSRCSSASGWSGSSPRSAPATSNGWPTSSRPGG